MQEEYIGSNVYSYHTFLYPFLWEDKETGSHSIYAFQSHMNCNEAWACDDMVSADGGLVSVESAAAFADQRSDYQEFQYFSPAARMALHKCDGDIVHGWRRKVVGEQELVKNIGEYRIYSDETGPRYVLNINQIRLRLFNTGVGILVFELEYNMPEGGIKQARQDVRAINELGRRLYPVVLPTDDKAALLDIFATKIEITLKDKANTTFQEDILGRSRSSAPTSEDGVPNVYLCDPHHKQSIITQILCNDDVDALEIIPAVDDRMFTCCCIVDAAYAEEFLGRPAFPDNESLRKLECDRKRQNAEWKYRTDWETGSELYALINVDLKYSSCQNREMLDRYLDEQLYLRWIEKGTILAVTNHSMFCITSPAVMSEVVIPFLTEYVRLCILVLAQRASLIAFDTRITRAISESKDQKTRNGAVFELARDFAIFQGQILIPEATSQIQGIELYAKLQKMLFVDKLQQNIQNRMANMYGVSQYERARRQEKQRKKIEKAFSWLTILTIASTLVDLYDFLTIQSTADFCRVLWYSLFVIGVCIAIYLMCILHKES